MKGYLFTNNLYLVIVTTSALFAYISKKNNLYWKDSDGIDFRILYLYCLANVILLCFESIFSLLALFTQKITFNFIIEYNLRNMKELISENNEHNNYLNVMCCPEITNYSSEYRNNTTYYHMINNL